MDYMFQDDYRLYFVMPYTRGVELFHLKQDKMTDDDPFGVKRGILFEEKIVKLWAFQIVHAIGYLHE